MTPGPVSDSYDPEFGTGANADTVREAIEAVRAVVTREIGTEHLEDIVTLAREYLRGYAPSSRKAKLRHLEVRLRIIRFCLDRAKESV